MSEPARSSSVPAAAQPPRPPRGWWRRLVAAVSSVALALGLGVLTATPAAAQTPCADLHVVAFTVAPGEPIEGQVATLTVKIRNSGTCVAQGFVTQWRQEPFGPAGPSAPVVDLAAGATVTLDLDYTFPRAGNFESTIVADSHNDVEETNEANNLQILPVTVLPATVDLSVTSVTLSPVHPVRGRTSTATVVVTNSGNSAAKAFTVSWQPAWFTSPIVRQANSLAAGASTTLTFTYTYPVDGTFDSSVTVDSGNTVAETNEFNNTKNFTVVVDPPLADLTVLNVDITPNNPVPGQVVTAKLTIKNIGNTDATSFRAQWQPWFLAPALSTEVPGLAAGATTTVSFDYTFPFAAVFEGTATVDPLFAVPELNEFNNSLAVRVPVAPNTIDLTITDMYVDREGKPTQGEPTTMAIVVTNKGNTASGPFAVDWNPDALYVISPSNQTMTKQVNDLGPGQSTTVRFTYSYPKAGNFSTLATADSLNRVLETNEANNQRLLPLTVGPGNIDLRVTGFTLSPAQPVRFSPTKATITVQNTGTFPAGPSFVEWRLHAADKAFNPTAFVNGLNPGESQTVTLEGTYFDVGNVTTTATADVFNSVVEPNGGENNNTVSKQITVVPPSAVLEVSLDSMRSFADGDSGIFKGTGEWNPIVFAVLDPNASCTLFGQTVKGVACRTFADDDVDDNSTVNLPANRSITVKLTDFTPLVMATAVIEDDSPLPPQFLGFAAAFSPNPDFLTFGTQSVDGQQGDCDSAPRCFRASFKVRVVSKVPAAMAAAARATAAGSPAAGDGPRITKAQRTVLAKFKAVLASGHRTGAAAQERQRPASTGR